QGEGVPDCRSHCIRGRRGLSWQRKLPHDEGTMKKFLFLFLALLAVPVDAAIIRINTARKLRVIMYSRTTNAAITGIAAASVTCRYVKDDSTTASFTPTASAGSNDWTEIGHGL